MTPGRFVLTLAAILFGVIVVPLSLSTPLVTGTRLPDVETATRLLEEGLSNRSPNNDLDGVDVTISDCRIDIVKKRTVGALPTLKASV